jgi:Tol biopolymer transport system component
MDAQFCGQQRVFQSIAPVNQTHRDRRAQLRLVALLLAASLLAFGIACKSDSEAQRVRPRQLRDVPSQRLAFTLTADVEPPANISTEEAKPIQAIQQDFDVRRKDEALVLHRTVASPDGQRALALYSGQDEPSTTFHIDLYASSGSFIRNLTPPDLAIVFQDSVLWSADSGYIAFIGRKAAQPQASPTPPGLEPPEVLESPTPTPTVMPAFPPIATFSTEQVYVCNRDGYDLRPLTTRDGLIYFALSWAPDGHALSALACKESEWDAREREFKTPSGRPRVISLDGQERLLDDQLAQAPPAWSPDSAKIATAFDVDIGIYDATARAPTQARIVLRERMLTASAAFDERSASKKSPDQSKPNAASTTTGVPVSFNPIVRIEWPVPEKLYVQTGYLDLRNALPTFSRWHLLTLSPQAAVLGK